MSKKQNFPHSRPAAAGGASPTSSGARRSDRKSSRRQDEFDPALLPSRDAILKALTAAGTPLLPDELVRMLDAPAIVHEALAGRLAAMEREGQVLTNRKGQICVVAKLDLTVGIVQGHPDGFGFLVPEDGGTDFFLSAREMHKVLHGDRVVVRMSGLDRKGRREGEIVEVLAARQQGDRGTPARGARRVLHRRREPAHQPGLPRPRRRHRQREGRRDRGRARSWSSPPATARPWRA